MLSPRALSSAGTPPPPSSNAAFTSKDDPIIGRGSSRLTPTLAFLPAQLGSAAAARRSTFHRPLQAKTPVPRTPSSWTIRYARTLFCFPPKMMPALQSHPSDCMHLRYCPFSQVPTQTSMHHRTRMYRAHREAPLPFPSALSTPQRTLLISAPQQPLSPPHELDTAINTTITMCPRRTTALTPSLTPAFRPQHSQGEHSP